MRYSSPRTLRQIVRYLRSKKGATLDEISRVPEVAKAYGHTDYDPMDLVFDAVKMLVIWRLVEAWCDEKLVPPETFALGTYDYLGGRGRRRYLYFISPYCIDLETALGVSFASTTHAIFGPPQRMRKRAQLFVLMPFLDELQPVYEDHIMKVGKRCGLSVARADDFFTHGTVMSDIWSAINQSDLIVADCTGRNPNVFYEVGLAHALGKATILTVQDRSDIPFDLQHIRVLQYSYNPRGMQEFEEALEETIRGVIAESGPTEMNTHE